MAKSSEQIKSEDRAKALQTAMKQINAKHKGQTLTQGVKFEVELLSTGILAFDEALGGGFIKGRAAELHGEEHSFKTASALVFTANCQKQGLVCAYFDVENRLNPGWARLLGVDWDTLVFSQESVAEKVFRTIEVLVDASAVDIVIVDSIGALIAEAELEDDIEKAKNKFAPVAKILSLCLRRLSVKSNKNGVTTIYINQLREDLSSMYKKYKTPGGKTLKHMLSTQVMINKANKSDMHTNEDKKIVGHDVNIQVVKNSAGGNFGRASFRYFYKTGVDKDYDLFAYCIQKDVIIQRASIYTFEDNTWKGKESVIEAISTDEELRTKLMEVAQSKITTDETDRNKKINELTETEDQDEEVEEVEVFDDAIGDLGTEEKVDDPVAKEMEKEVKVDDVSATS